MTKTTRTSVVYNSHLRQLSLNKYHRYHRYIIRVSRDGNLDVNHIRLLPSPYVCYITIVSSLIHDIQQHMLLKYRSSSDN